jgi:tetratricopeptide (TPR) repeat protein
MATADELYERGVDLFAEGKLAEAIEAYRQALTIDPGFVDALHGLAMAAADSGDLETAIETARHITEVTPDDPLGFTSLSMFLQRAGRIEDAEAAAAQARVKEWKAELKK